jgi:dsDNA-binding SOS-regulon protein
MPVVARYLVERNGQLVTDQEGEYLMYADKAQADAHDRKLDAIESLAEMMTRQEVKGIEYDLAYQLAEKLVDQVEEIQNIIKPVIADNKKRPKSGGDGDGEQ